MKKIIFKGCGTAIITPFTKDGVNFEEFEKLIENQIANKVDSLIVCGTTGEAATMTTEERKKVMEFAIKIANKRVPIILGTGSNCTKTAIEMTKYAESIGADGALVVTPYYNKTTQAGLVAHYKAIAEATSLPIILYNVPGRTGVNIKPETCLELSRISNIVAIKEASGNLSQVAEISKLCRNDLNIYSGNDDQIIPILSVGGIGVISVLSNLVPEYVHNMCYEYFEGKVESSKEKQLKSLDLVSALFCEVNPIPVKEAMNLLGYNCYEPRLPLIKLSENGKEKLEKAMKEFGIM